MSHAMSWSSTMQDAEHQLKMELAMADKMGCVYGVKLVRGAYMEQERKLANREKYEDPIWPDKLATDACYHHLMEMLMQERARRRTSSQVHFMIASHNEGTIRMATEM